MNFPTLDALPPDATDAQIAAAVARALINAAPPNDIPPRYMFAVEWDSAIGPCPVKLDHIITSKKIGLVIRNDRAWCLAWVLRALEAGLRVGRTLGTGAPVVHWSSINSVRYKLECKHRPRLDDEEIPF